MNYLRLYGVIDLGMQIDQSYIRRILDGDTAAYAPIVEALQEPVVSMIRSMVGDEFQAEDLAQEVFVKAFFALKKFRGDSSFNTWIFRIAYNETVSFLRKKKIAVAMSLDNREEVEEEEPGSFEEKERKEAVLSLALAQLPPGDRYLIDAFYWQGRSVRELSSICGLTESNVKVRLHRIKRRLKLIMEEEENGLCI